MNGVSGRWWELVSFMGSCNGPLGPLKHVVCYRYRSTQLSCTVASGWSSTERFVWRPLFKTCGRGDANFLGKKKRGKRHLIARKSSFVGRVCVCVCACVCVCVCVCFFRRCKKDFVRFWEWVWLIVNKKPENLQQSLHARIYFLYIYKYLTSIYVYSLWYIAPLSANETHKFPQQSSSVLPRLHFKMLGRHGE